MFNNDKTFPGWIGLYYKELDGVLITREMSRSATQIELIAFFFVYTAPDLFHCTPVCVFICSGAARIEM